MVYNEIQMNTLKIAQATHYVTLNNELCSGRAFSFLSTVVVSSLTKDYKQNLKRTLCVGVVRQTRSA